MLPRFVRETWDDCRDAFEQLVFLFRHINTFLEMPGGCKDKAIEDIFESAKISNLSEEELMQYERKKKYLSDYAAALAYAKKEGHGEGILIGDAIGESRGIAIGIKQDRSYIKELLKQGMSAEELLERLDNDD